MTTTNNQPVPTPVTYRLHADVPLHLEVFDIKGSPVTYELAGEIMEHILESARMDWEFYGDADDQLEEVREAIITGVITRELIHIHLDMIDCILRDMHEIEYVDTF